MKYLKQFSIIAIITFIGELLNHVIPLPVPASIYGLVLMFAALKLKIFPLEEVKETGSFLLNIMPILFVPPSVSLILAFPVLKQYWWQFILIAVVSTILVMAVTGWVTQGVMHLSSKGKSKSSNTDCNAEDNKESTSKENEKIENIEDILDGRN